MSSVRHRMVVFCATVGAALVAATLCAHAQDKPGIDVTGAWAFEVQTQAGTGTPTVTFKQEGETLTGHYSSATLGEADLKGTVKGTAITFALSVNVQGYAIDVTYSGTIDTKDSMKGTVSFAGVGDGSFTARRKE